VRLTLKVVMQTDRDFVEVIVLYSCDCHKCNNFQLKFQRSSINAARIVGHLGFILKKIGDQRQHLCTINFDPGYKSFYWWL